MPVQYDLSRPEVVAHLPGAPVPYWNTIARCRGIGFVRSTKGRCAGRWVARASAVEGGYLHCRLGDATELDYPSALSKANQWFEAMQEACLVRSSSPSRTWRIRPAFMIGDYTIEHALADYVNQFPGTSPRARDEYYRATNIIQLFGPTPCKTLTSRDIEKWRCRQLMRIATNANRRTGGSITKRERIARNHRTMNRYLATLKGALDHAYRCRLIGSDEAWKDIKYYQLPAHSPATALTDEAISALRANASDDLRMLVDVALGTGCRIGELIKLCCQDVIQTSGKLFVRAGKTGRNRSIVLSTKDLAILRALAGERPRDEPLLTRKAAAWTYGNAYYELRRARDAADLTGGVNFHAFRHTYATRLARSGVPITLIARQLGHSTTYLTEKLYIHATETLDDAILRDALG